MKKLKFNYVCAALGVLCLLLMSCKDDDNFVDKEELVGTELVNYEMTLFKVLDNNEPESISKNCILYYDNYDYKGEYAKGDLFYKGDRYTLHRLPLLEMKTWTQNSSSVKVLLSGVFEEEYTHEHDNNTRNLVDTYTNIYFDVSSITLKK